MDLNARISIAGHRGLVGSAILRNLQARGYTNFVLRTHEAKTLMEGTGSPRHFGEFGTMRFSMGAGEPRWI